MRVANQRWPDQPSPFGTPDKPTLKRILPTIDRRRPPASMDLPAPQGGAPQPGQPMPAGMAGMQGGAPQPGQPMPAQQWWRGGAAHGPSAGAPLAWQMNQVNEGGYEYQIDPRTGAPLRRTALQNTERYQGDNFLRGLDGVDQLGAYDAETRRFALQGLMGAFGNMTGGGGAPMGFNVSGPGGPVASLNYNTSINPQQQVFDPQSGAAQMQAAPAHYAGTPGANAFAHNHAGLGQANATQHRRGAAQQQNQFFNQAQGAQNRNVLGGLSQGINQRNNARGRQNQAFGMAGNMMMGLMR